MKETPRSPNCPPPPEGLPHLSTEDWLRRAAYVDRLGRRLKLRRLAWLAADVTLFYPWPYFLGRGFRRWLLRRFGADLAPRAVVYPSARVWAPWNLTMGEGAIVDRNVYLYCVAPIRLGAQVSVSDGAFLCTASHDVTRLDHPLTYEPIVVRDGAWIGAQAYVGPGVTVGEGAVVAARAVVTRDVPAWAIVAGNPARIVKWRHPTP